MISLMRSTHRSVNYNKRLKSHTEADDGLGVPIEERQQIFQRFYRLKRSSKIEATALGLAFVAAVAALHGSQLTVEDNDPGLRILMNFDGVRACDVSETRIAAGELAIPPGSRSVSGNQQVC
jgi:nitrogen fixation/metabolism regulation signal transduction histidine kinase